MKKGDRVSMKNLNTGEFEEGIIELSVWDLDVWTHLVNGRWYLEHELRPLPSDEELDLGLALR